MLIKFLYDFRFRKLCRNVLISAMCRPLPLISDFFICFNKSPLKRMKNTFHFMLKTLVLAIYTFLSWLFGYVEKRFDDKIYDVTDWITIDILSNISASKNNQTMKFGQLIEYKMRNIFLGKSNTNCGGEANPKPFYKKSKLSLSLNQQPKML